MVKLLFNFNEKAMVELDPGSAWFPPGLIACSTFCDHIQQDESDHDP
jgi:hypothetical protein